MWSTWTVSDEFKRKLLEGKLEGTVTEEKVTKRLVRALYDVGRVEFARDRDMVTVTLYTPGGVPIVTSEAQRVGPHDTLTLEGIIAKVEIRLTGP